MLEVVKADQMLRGWVQANRNSALLDDAQFKQAADFHRAYELPVHNNVEKSWDNLIALHEAIVSTGPDDRVLDAGAERYSVFLPALRKLGYSDLTAINLTLKEPEVIGGIRFQYGDITDTGFPPEHFAFVSCLSVLEHGVDWRKFLVEATRILKPGGRIFASVDYWEAPTDTKGKMAYGVPIYIFDAREIIRMYDFASSLGLRGEAMNLRCKQQTIHWMGLDYTFFNICFQKEH